MQQTKHTNIVLLRGASLWLLMALLLAWCMVALTVDVPPFKLIFAGKFTRLLQVIALVKRLLLCCCRLLSLKINDSALRATLS